MTQEWPPPFRDAVLLSPRESGMILEEMDLMNNIDYLAREPWGQLIPIASRMQRDCFYRTFTIRKERVNGMETELSKMQRAIRDGSMAPGWFVHGYVRERDWKLIGLFGARRQTIFDNLHLGEVKENGADGNRFMCFDVDRLWAAEAGVRWETPPVIETIRWPMLGVTEWGPASCCPGGIRCR
jgi:hypothetical protein